MKALNEEVELHFEARGHGEPSLLFIHGLGGNLRVWDAQLDYFSKTRRVAAIDLRGHGASARPPDYSQDGFCADARAVARATGLEKPVVVGWSLGGAIAIDYAGAYRDELSGVVLVDHNVHVVKTPDLPLGMEPEFFETLLRLLRDDYEGAGTDAMVESWMADGQESLVEIRSLLGQSLLNTPKWVVSAIRSKTWGDRRPALRKVAVPALILQGGASRLGGREMASYINAHIPKGRVHIVEGHGHALHLTAPDEFNRVLADFIREVS